MNMMNIVQSDLKIAPKDTPQSGIPTLPCDSGERSSVTTVPSLAMAYVPMQHFRELYEDHEYALQIGTIFKELDLPFYGIGGCLL